MPYDEETEKIIRDDFHRLWNTNFLDNLSIEKERLHLLERRRRQAHHLQHGGAAARQDRRLRRLEEDRDVEDRREAEGWQWRKSASTPSSIPALVRKVAGIVRDMLKEKGFQSAEVTPEIVPMPGGPKLVHLTFHLDEGPKVKIKKIEFIGNKAFSDEPAEEADEGEHGKPGCSRSSTAAACIRKPSSTRTPSKITEFYRENGYIQANVGVPELKCHQRLRGQEDALDRAAHPGHRRPPLQGRRRSTFDGNTVIKTEYLKPLSS